MHIKYSSKFHVWGVGNVAFQEWCEKNPNQLYLLSCVSMLILSGIFGIISAIILPIGTLEDPAFELLGLFFVFIAIFMTMLPVSYYILKIKGRSMWWLLLFLKHSALWLTPIDKKCDTKIIFGVILFDSIIGIGIIATFEYFILQPIRALLYAVVIYIISEIIADNANRNLSNEITPSIASLSINEKLD